MSKVSKSDYEALASFRAKLRRFLRFAEEAARLEGLTPQQYQILLAIQGQPGREWASIRDLTDAMQLKHHTVVELVNRSEQVGLVKRTPDLGDKRMVRVTLTERGAQILELLAAKNLQELETLRVMIQVPES